VGLEEVVVGAGRLCVSNCGGDGVVKNVLVKVNATV
jgi:hypothetical protein